MMRMTVTAMLAADDGEPIWEFSRSEVVIPERGDNPSDGMLTFGQRLLDSIDEAKASISAQLRANATYRDDA